jgi:hypothetical protein
MTWVILLCPSQPVLAYNQRLKQLSAKFPDTYYLDCGWERYPNGYIDAGGEGLSPAMLLDGVHVTLQGRWTTPTPRE